MARKQRQFSRVGGVRSERKRVTVESRTPFQHRSYGHKSTGGTAKLFRKLSAS